MCKAFNKTKVIWRYVEALALHTVALTVHWEDNTSCIYGVFHKKPDNLLVETAIFAILGVSFCVTQKTFNFIELKKL